MRGEWVEAPTEMYLREFRDTPTGDLEALADFSRLGMVRTTVNTPQEAYRDLPISDPDQWQRALFDVSGLLPDDPEWWWRGDEFDRAQVWKDHIGYFPVHAAEVAIRVRCVQRATDHLIAYRENRPLQDVWPDCKDEDEAWHRFTRITGAALRDFHVRVEVQTRHEPAEEWTIGGVHQPTLYSIAMLQLVNDLAEEVPFLRCANEACGRLFVRQRGRTTYGGNRMRGVMYCSSTCARAQYQREKRRRDRSARKGSAG
jgi:hypothetical protein